MNLLIVILGMGAITFALRLSMIMLADRWMPGPLLRKALSFVPPAVLAAIIAPEMLRPGDGSLWLAADNPRLWAGLLAIAVARLTGSTIWTVVVGMGALWLLQYLP